MCWSSHVFGSMKSSLRSIKNFCLRQNMVAVRFTSWLLAASSKVHFLLSLLLLAVRMNIPAFFVFVIVVVVVTSVLHPTTARPAGAKVIARVGPLAASVARQHGKLAVAGGHHQQTGAHLQRPHDPRQPWPRLQQANASVTGRAASHAALVAWILSDGCCMHGYWMGKV